MRVMGIDPGLAIMGYGIIDWKSYPNIPIGCSEYRMQPMFPLFYWKPKK